MQKWEMCIRTVWRDNDDEDPMLPIYKLGEDGWELVSMVTAANGRFVFAFKRPAPESRVRKPRM